MKKECTRRSTVPLIRIAMATLREKKRPRVLLQNLDDETVKALAALYPTTKVIKQLDEVYQGDFDALIAIGECKETDPHMFVLHFGGSQFGRCDPPEHERGTVHVVKSENRSMAESFTIPAELPDSIKSLARHTIVPVIEKSRGHWTLDLNPRNPGVDSVVRPFLVGSDKRIVAGFFRRLGRMADAWVLPGGTSRKLDWVRAALKEWAKEHPDRFSPQVKWQDNPEWRSAEEDHLFAKLEATKGRREAELERLQREEAEIQKEIDAARSRGRAGARSLLLNRGESLVDSVKSVFEALGFHVIKVDPQRSKSDKLEDLQIREKGPSETPTLVEVAAYPGGAKVSDLLRMGRFVKRYLRENSSEPNGQWYVVNQFAGEDPSQRKPPLAGNPEEIAEFSMDGGLVIDTADLFRVAKAVAGGDLDAGAARTLLMSRNGVFSYSSTVK